MATDLPQAKSGRRFNSRQNRLILYCLLLLCVAAWRFIPRPWQPSRTLRTPHQIIYSTATQQQIANTAQALDLLYTAYSNRFGALPQFEHSHAPLRFKLYKDRDEMRAVHPSMGWAEAFYQQPYCYAYFGAKEINPYHWMLHESVHQLNNEVAHLHLEKWLEEGLAGYFSTSRMLSNELAVGRIDLNTYPVWWLELLATAPTLEENLRNKSVIPLRSIIENRGGPSMNGHFNLYYLHWWTLTHIIFEDEHYRSNAVKLVQIGGGLAAFEQLIGPVEKVQTEWHAYVRHLKAAVATDPNSFGAAKCRP